MIFPSAFAHSLSLTHTSDCRWCTGLFAVLQSLYASVRAHFHCRTLFCATPPTPIPFFLPGPSRPGTPPPHQRNHNTSKQWAREIKCGEDPALSTKASLARGGCRGLSGGLVGTNCLAIWKCTADKIYKCFQWQRSAPIGASLHFITACGLLSAFQ